MSFPSKKRFTLTEVLENIDFFTEDDEKGPMKSETTIFITPLQEADDDLSEEDCTEFDLNNLGRNLLCAEEAYRQGAALLVFLYFSM